MDQAAQPGAHKGCYIRELQADQDATFLAVVKQKDLKTRKDGEPFLTLTLGDCTGEIDAIRWENAAADAALFSCGDVLKVKGFVGGYRGKLQLRIDRFRKATPDEIDRSDYIAASAFPPEQMLCDLRGIILTLDDKPIQRLLTMLLDEHTDQLLVAPAAQRIHHCFAAGLLEHMLSMARVADLLSQHYTRLNRNWLIAGVVLHDFGKLEELTMDLHIAYTVPGQIVGHIGLGLVLLERYSERARLDGFTKTMLQHLIVSHHGVPEFGALKLPMTPEAIALHSIDELDSKLEAAFRLIDAAPAQDEFTSYVKAMSRALYCARKP